MDSLPEQHIDKLPTATREAAYRKVGLVFVARREGSKSEEEVARNAGFGSVDAMHHQMKVWGFSGLLPPVVELQAPRAKAPKTGTERKGRVGGGEAEELPAAADARDMFEYAIARLKSDLHQTEHLHEVLQDGRFEATYVHPKEEAPHPFVYLRDGVSAERWEELCAEQGKDPASTDTLYVYENSRYLGGTSPWPTRHLVRLIAAYCICAKSPDEVRALLDRLHPKSRKPYIEQINNYLTGNEGLLPAAKKLAQVVRGKPVKRGLNAVGEDLFYHTAGDFVRALSAQGVPREEIVRALRDEYREDNLSDGEISRLFDVFPPRRPD
jgi:hypothetical protein